MIDLVKVLEGIKPIPKIPYYTYITLEDGRKLFYRPNNCRGENCCNSFERDNCSCEGKWEEWDWGKK